jgi:hypothetical protein
MNKTYTIKYWIDEEAREHAISHMIEEDGNELSFTQAGDAIEVAKKARKDGSLACVEVISSDEDEGDYGVVYHSSVDGESVNIIALNS